MPAVVRNILAVLAGFVAGGIVIAMIQAINTRLYPLPAGFDPGNREMMRQHMATLPPLAFGIVLLSYAAGFPIAVFLAARLSATAPARQGVLIAAFFGAASVMNLLALPHPAWFWVGNFVVLFCALWAGIRGGARRPPVSPGPDKA